MRKRRPMELYPYYSICRYLGILCIEYDSRMDRFRLRRSVIFYLIHLVVQIYLISCMVILVCFWTFHFNYEMTATGNHYERLVLLSAMIIQFVQNAWLFLLQKLQIHVVRQVELYKRKYLTGLRLKLPQRLFVVLVFSNIIYFSHFLNACITDWLGHISVLFRISTIGFFLRALTSSFIQGTYISLIHVIRHLLQCNQAQLTVVVHQLQQPKRSCGDVLRLRACLDTHDRLLILCTDEVSIVYGFSIWLCLLFSSLDSTSILYITMVTDTGKSVYENILRSTIWLLPTIMTAATALMSDTVHVQLLRMPETFTLPQYTAVGNTYFVINFGVICIVISLIYLGFYASRQRLLAVLAFVLYHNHRDLRNCHAKRFLKLYYMLGMLCARFDDRECLLQSTAGSERYALFHMLIVLIAALASFIYVCLRPQELYMGIYNDTGNYYELINIRSFCIGLCLLHLCLYMRRQRHIELVSRLLRLHRLCTDAAMERYFRRNFNVYVALAVLCLVNYLNGYARAGLSRIPTLLYIVVYLYSFSAMCLLLVFFVCLQHIVAAGLAKFNSQLVENISVSNCKHLLYKRHRLLDIVAVELIACFGVLVLPIVPLVLFLAPSGPLFLISTVMEGKLKQPFEYIRYCITSCLWNIPWLAMITFMLRSNVITTEVSQ
ncbi:hypothetical protein AWZ03_010982 [Drosophila navojoa]|uniref:Gustatory receptor n=1 Tax=Drosophila navojoa TaxID=7232 RepID=A0A484B176_DRONA|nr:hypothetical protein AWZ03_010982 [Drosophila navojoa]